MSKEKVFNVRKMAVTGMLGALAVILGLTPVGFIPIGPTKATIMHIPVIIGAIMEGPVTGAFVGLIFGITSIYQAVAAPTPVSFVFLNPVVSVIPRVLAGIIPYLVYKGLNKLGSRKTVWIINMIWAAITVYLAFGIYNLTRHAENIWMIVVNAVLTVLAVGMVILTNKKSGKGTLDIVAAAVTGTLTNTVLVLGFIFLFYGRSFVEALGLEAALAGKIIAGIGIANGIPEIVAAVLIVTAVVSALKKWEESTLAKQNSGQGKPI